jgi:hypothetical protein
MVRFVTDAIRSTSLDKTHWLYLYAAQQDSFGGAPRNQSPN